MFRTLAGLALLAAALLLGGCATVPMGEASQDARLKTFPAPRPGRAGLYIYRNEVFGSAIKLPLVLDGASLGQTGPKTYFFAELVPGRHTVASQGENTDTLDFNAVAGKLYFVWQEVKMGAFQARTKLSLVSEDAGRRGVQESALAASSLPSARAQPGAPPPATQATQAAQAPPTPQGSQAANGRYAGSWSGTYRCGPYSGSTPTSTPGPWSIPVSMAVAGDRATLSRGDASYSEDLQGFVGADGSVALSGQGAMFQSRNVPWTTQFRGRFTGNPERFEATGNMKGANGVVFRVCLLDLARGAAP